MKKILSVFLAVMMLITSVPFTSLGVSSSDPISLPKSTYEVGEAIIPEIWDVSYSSWDWIGLYLKDDSIDGSVESLWWIYAAYVTDSTNFANGTGGQDFTPNTTRPDFYNYFVNGLIAPGKYKLVYFEDDSYTSTDCEYFTVVEGNPGQGGEVVNPDGERPDVTNVSIGDKITLGTYNGEPITWVCVDIDENGPLMLSEDVLCYKQFDAAGSDSTYHTDGWGYIRESYGSNCWYDSNIRQWLNTSGTVEYSHCKPIYSNEVGFMSNFSEAELSCVKNVTQKTYVNSWESKRTGYTDGGSTAVPPVTTIAELDRDYSSYWYQNVTDSFFLLGQEQIYNIYSNDSSYVYYDTPYITRIVGNNDVGACFEQVYVVNGKNSLAISSAYSNNGIRPAFYLDVDGFSDEPEDVVTGEQFPVGYDFYEDSYSFENYTSVIPYGYFKTMYNDGKAWSLCTKNWLQGGVCFGMSYTTASLYNGLPSGHTIRNLSGNSVLSIGNYSLTLETFIDYAHIYQFSQEFAEGTVWTNGTTIYNLVKQYLENDNIGVTIGMTRKDKTGGHRVLAIGIDGNDILIDDPNNMDSYERLTVNSDGSWTFSGLAGWNNATCNIRYNLDYFGPYKFIRTMTPLNVNDSFIDNSTIESIAQNSTSDYLSKDSVLLSVKSSDYSLKNKEFDKVEFESTNTLDQSDDFDLYWIDKDETITITDIETEGSEIEVAGNDNIVKIKLDSSPEVNVTIDEEENIAEANVATNKGDSFEIDRVSFDDNSNPQILTISGTANGTEITATQTETGLLVTGISDGTVTLSKDDEVISTQEIKDAESDIEITYDTDGSSDDLDVEYHSHSYSSTETKTATCKEKGEITYTCSCEDTYTEEIPVNPDNHIGKTEVRNSSESTCEKNGYTGDIYCLDCGEKILEGESKELLDHNYNADGICEMCGKDRTENCTHMCHKTGFMGIIWKILRFFYKLFGSNPVCQCGVKHY